MKFLTLHQPWASLVACGAKRVETRSWPTSYRGALGICAGKSFRLSERITCWEPPFNQCLVAVGINHPDSLPRGAVVAVARLVDCVVADELAPYLTAQEKAFGNYGPDRWAWKLEDIVQLDPPFACIGHHRLWWDAPLAELVYHRLGWTRPLLKANG